jgi:putative endonuclease
MITCIKGSGEAHAAPSNVFPWFVYILHCADGTLYTGCTTDVTRRLHEHNSTCRGAKYTRSRRPVTLLAVFPFSNRSEAQREESRIKRLRRVEKLLLIERAGA